MSPLPFDLGPYRVVERLGAGGFATVYRALLRGDMGFTSEVALKVLHEHVTEDQPEVLRLLADEARLLSHMRHSGIVAARWFGQLQPGAGGDPQHALVMEYVRGATLSRIIEWLGAGGEVLEPELLVEVLVELARALEHAHTLRADGEALNLVHRDLKPSNVMISDEGEVKLLDFGIARAEGRLSDHTGTGMVRGSARYMSPEQVSGEEVDFRSDLFSLGALAYEAATGEPLFGARTLPAAMLQIGSTDIRPLLDEADDIEPELLPVLRRLLAPYPADRYARTSDLLADLLEQRSPRDGRGALKRLVARVRAASAPVEGSASIKEATGAKDGSFPWSAAESAAAPPEVPPEPDPDVGPTRLQGNTDSGQDAAPPPRRWIGATLLLVALAAGGLWWTRPAPPAAELPSPIAATAAPSPSPSPAEAPTPTAAPTPSTTPPPTALARATPRPTPGPPPLPAAAGPPGILKIAAEGSYAITIGARRYTALDGRRGISLSAGEHVVVLECIADCDAGAATRREVPVTVPSGGVINAGKQRF